MSPMLFKHYKRNACLVYPKHFSDLSLEIFTGRVKSPNLKNLLGCEFSPPVLLPLGGGFGMNPETMFISERRSSLLDHVLRVFRACSWVEVLPSAARGPVTGMHNNIGVWVRSAVKPAGYPMSPEVFSAEDALGADKESPIALPVPRAFPLPAFSLWSLTWSLINKLQKSLDIIHRKRGEWFRIVTGHGVLLIRSLMGREALIALLGSPINYSPWYGFVVPKKGEQCVD